MNFVNPYLFDAILDGIPHRFILVQECESTEEPDNFSPPRFTVGAVNATRDPRFSTLKQLMEVGVTDSALQIPPTWLMAHQYIYIVNDSTDDFGWQYRSQWSANGPPGPKDEPWINRLQSNSRVRRRIWMATIVPRSELVRSKRWLAENLRIDYGNVKMQGELYRYEKGTLTKQWAKRRVILYHNRIEVVGSGNKKSAEFSLQDCEVKILFDHQTPGGQNVFAIRNLNGSVGLLFGAEDQDTRRAWVLALQYQLMINAPEMNFVPLEYSPPTGEYPDNRVHIAGDLKLRGKDGDLFQRTFQLLPREVVYYEGEELKGRVFVEESVISAEERSLNFALTSKSGITFNLSAETAEAKNLWMVGVRKTVNYIDQYNSMKKSLPKEQQDDPNLSVVDRISQFYDASWSAPPVAGEDEDYLNSIFTAPYENNPKHFEFSNELGINLDPSLQPPPPPPQIVKTMVAPVRAPTPPPIVAEVVKVVEEVKETVKLKVIEQEARANVMASFNIDSLVSKRLSPKRVVINPRVMLAALRGVTHRFVLIMEVENRVTASRAIQDSAPPRFTVGGSRASKDPRMVKNDHLIGISSKNPEVQLPSGWFMLHPYIYIVQQNTDDDGWQYRSTWSDGPVSGSEEPWVDGCDESKFVRRRLWMTTVVKREEVIRAKKMVMEELNSKAPTEHILMEELYVYNPQLASTASAWQRRTVLLDHDRLEIRSGSEKAGEIPLADCEVKILNGKETAGRSFPFLLSHPNGSITVYLDADSREVRLRWVRAILYQLSIIVPMLNFNPFAYSPPTGDIAENRILLCGELQVMDAADQWDVFHVLLQEQSLLFYSKDGLLKGRVLLDHALVKAREDEAEFSIKSAFGLLVHLRASSSEHKFSWVLSVKRQIEQMEYVRAKSDAAEDTVAYLRSRLKHFYDPDWVALEGEFSEEDSHLSALRAKFKGSLVQLWDGKEGVVSSMSESVASSKKELPPGMSPMPPPNMMVNKASSVLRSSDAMTEIVAHNSNNTAFPHLKAGSSSDTNTDRGSAIEMANATQAQQQAQVYQSQQASTVVVSERTIVSRSSNVTNTSQEMFIDAKTGQKTITSAQTTVIIESMKEAKMDGKEAERESNKSVTQFSSGRDLKSVPLPPRLGGSGAAAAATTVVPAAAAVEVAVPPPTQSLSPQKSQKERMQEAIDSLEIPEIDDVHDDSDEDNDEFAQAVKEDEHPQEAGEKEQQQDDEAPHTPAHRHHITDGGLSTNSAIRRLNEMDLEYMKQKGFVKAASPHEAIIPMEVLHGVDQDFCLENGLVDDSGEHAVLRLEDIFDLSEEDEAALVAGAPPAGFSDSFYVKQQKAIAQQEADQMEAFRLEETTRLAALKQQEELRQQVELRQIEELKLQQAKQAEALRQQEIMRQQQIEELKQQELLLAKQEALRKEKELRQQQQEVLRQQEALRQQEELRQQEVLKLEELKLNQAREAEAFRQQREEEFRKLEALRLQEEALRQQQQEALKAEESKQQQQEAHRIETLRLEALQQQEQEKAEAVRLEQEEHDKKKSKQSMRILKSLGSSIRDTVTNRFNGLANSDFIFDEPVIAGATDSKEMIFTITKKDDKKVVQRTVENKLKSIVATGQVASKQRVEFMREDYLQQNALIQENEDGQFAFISIVHLHPDDVQFLIEQELLSEDGKQVVLPLQHLEEIQDMLRQSRLEKAEVVAPTIAAPPSSLPTAAILPAPPSAPASYKKATSTDEHDTGDGDGVAIDLTAAGNIGKTNSSKRLGSMDSFFNMSNNTEEDSEEIIMATRGSPSKAKKAATDTNNTVTTTTVTGDDVEGDNIKVTEGGISKTMSTKRLSSMDSFFNMHKDNDDSDDDKIIASSVVVTDVDASFMSPSKPLASTDEHDLGTDINLKSMSVHRLARGDPSTTGTSIEGFFSPDRQLSIDGDESINSHKSITVNFSSPVVKQTIQQQQQPAPMTKTASMEVAAKETLVKYTPKTFAIISDLDDDLDLAEIKPMDLSNRQIKIQSKETTSIVTDSSRIMTMEEEVVVYEQKVNSSVKNEQQEVNITTETGNRSTLARAGGIVKTATVTRIDDSKPTLKRPHLSSPTNKTIQERQLAQVARPQLKQKLFRRMQNADMAYFKREGKVVDTEDGQFAFVATELVHPDDLQFLTEQELISEDGKQVVIPMEHLQEIQEMLKESQGELSVMTITDDQHEQSEGDIASSALELVEVQQNEELADSTTAGISDNSPALPRMAKMASVKSIATEKPVLEKHQLSSAAREIEERKLAQIARPQLKQKLFRRMQNADMAYFKQEGKVVDTEDGQFAFVATELIHPDDLQFLTEQELISEDGKQVVIPIEHLQEIQEMMKESQGEVPIMAKEAESEETGDVVAAAVNLSFTEEETNTTASSSSETNTTTTTTRIVKTASTKTMSSSENKVTIEKYQTNVTAGSIEERKLAQVARPSFKSTQRLIRRVQTADLAYFHQQGKVMDTEDGQFAFVAADHVHPDDLQFLTEQELISEDGKQVVIPIEHLQEIQEMLRENFGEVDEGDEKEEDVAEYQDEQEDSEEESPAAYEGRPLPHTPSARELLEADDDDDNEYELSDDDEEEGGSRPTSLRGLQALGSPSIAENAKRASARSLNLARIEEESDEASQQSKSSRTLRHVERGDSDSKSRLSQVSLQHMSQAYLNDNGYLRDNGNYAMIPMSHLHHVDQDLVHANGFLDDSGLNAIIPLKSSSGQLGTAQENESISRLVQLKPVDPAIRQPLQRESSGTIKEQVQLRHVDRTSKNQPRDRTSADYHSSPLLIAKQKLRRSSLTTPQEDEESSAAQSSLLPVADRVGSTGSSQVTEEKASPFKLVKLKSVARREQPVDNSASSVVPDDDDQSMASFADSTIPDDNSVTPDGPPLRGVRRGSSILNRIQKFESVSKQKSIAAGPRGSLVKQPSLAIRKPASGGIAAQSSPAKGSVSPATGPKPLTRKQSGIDQSSGGKTLSRKMSGIVVDPSAAASSGREGKTLSRKMSGIEAAAAVKSLTRKMSGIDASAAMTISPAKESPAAPASTNSNGEFDANAALQAAIAASASRSASAAAAGPSFMQPTLARKASFRPDSGSTQSGRSMTRKPSFRK